jgi:molybdopterin-containing oxidoreductase family membrane subunit
LTTPFNQSFWLLEIFFGIVIPVIILLSPALRKRDRYAITALGFVIIGVIINRCNVTLSGLVAPPVWSPGVLGNVVAAAYFPSWVEIAVSLGVLGYALLGFTLGIRYLPLYPTEASDTPPI